MYKFKRLISLLILPITMTIFTTSSLIAPAAFADDEICSNPNVSEATKAAAGCSTGTVPELKDVITNIINGIIAVIGFVAVIFIIYGGIQYMTSAGDTAKTTKARNTIFYALIGLVICVLAFVIVNFIANILNSANTGSPTP